MKKLNSLELALKKLDSKRNELRDKISEVRIATEKPKLVEKYQGKYFRYVNSYSGSENWFAYVFCKEITDCNHVIYDTFQIDNDGLVRIDFDYETFGFVALETEITKEEYDQQLEFLINKINTLKK